MFIWNFAVTLSLAGRMNLIQVVSLAKIVFDGVLDVHLSAEALGRAEEERGGRAGVCT